uniref:RING-type E3 ubiquitin transferase n=1 Tax=Oryza brachyantha TaxID=4533 RepID=J3LMF2_ORYBR
MEPWGFLVRVLVGPSLSSFFVGGFQGFGASGAWARQVFVPARSGKGFRAIHKGLWWWWRRCWPEGAMSFVFRGSRADIEAGGFPGFAPERRAMVSVSGRFYTRFCLNRIHAGGRPVNSNLAFLVTVLMLFMVLNSHQMSPNFLLWLVLGVFLMATSLRMYATCQQLQAQAQAHAAAANGFLGTELRVHVPPTIALATRGRLQSLRLQLALLDREFDDLDYDALRALDADNSPHAPSMSEEEINALPVFKYKVQAQGNASSRKSGPSQPSISSTEASNELALLEIIERYLVNLGLVNIVVKKQDLFKADGTDNTLEDELTCTVCLEQVIVGDLLRSLPCLHQFHANCIDPWLRQQGTCPVCKHRVSDGWHSEADASNMV